MKFFNLKKKERALRIGDTYAVSAGVMAGQLLIYMESKESDLCFLTIPLQQNQTISKETFDFGLENCIIEYVERVPKSVRTVTRAKYDENLQGV